MIIKGFIHETEDQAFYGTVHIVKDIRRYAGEYVGYMELSDSGLWVQVKKHPCGTLNGQIMKD